MISKMIYRVADAIEKASPRISGGYVNYYDLARAAIEAMREPTEDMISAFYKENYGSATEGWHDMIDAALDHSSVNSTSMSNSAPV